MTLKSSTLPATSAVALLLSFDGVIWLPTSLTSSTPGVFRIVSTEVIIRSGHFVIEHIETAKDPGLHKTAPRFARLQISEAAELSHVSFRGAHRPGDEVNCTDVPNTRVSTDR